MKNITITIFILLVVVVLGLYLVSFQVRETESAMVMTFDKPTREITEPGWYFKWPAPIQSFVKFDSRMRVLEAETGETTTKGAGKSLTRSNSITPISTEALRKPKVNCSARLVPPRIK